MKILILIPFLFFYLESFSQLDSSNVFVVGKVEKSSIEVRKINERTTFKFDVAKIYLAQSLFSIEHLLANEKSSIEPEINIFWEPLDWVLNYYSNEKASYIDNNINSTPSSYQFGLGLGYKRYVDKRKKGLFGHYIALKIRSRFGFISQKLSTAYVDSLVPEPVNYYNGLISINELSAYYGYSFWAFDLAQIDPFIGLSVSGTYIKYGWHEPSISNAWTLRQEITFKPSVLFGLRLGVPSNMWRLLRK